MSFEGFPDEGLIFYEGLEADNSKTYWTRNKAAYETHVRAPLQAMLEELAPAFGPASLTALANRGGEIEHALPKQLFYAVHAEPKLFFEPSDFSRLIADPEIIGLHISPKGRGNQAPVAGSLYAWAAERFT